ncbi:protein EXORDIUM-like 5 [Tripterygium wilfordii]|uniref:Protein EXORDIUM-like 5 n=1 Tax=Tripterygium wilfordii TaxID=458696 RepID=A0A7J7BZ21_TRIWF|nr:protein EXORDIUM-like 5 [Tripterygium wilfordii]KAF5727111.1 protein EXORDIUM-like 5 [Tripterygium wilfordii]
MSVPHFLSVLLATFVISSISSSATISSSKAQTFNIKPESFFNPKLPPRTLSSNKKFEGSSNLVDLRYHMGPVLSSSPIKIYLIWYGRWSAPQQLLIKDFILSISSLAEPSPSVADWWRTVSLYTDQTGANVSKSLFIAGEYSDTAYSHGNQLTRLSIQQVIATAVKSAPLPVDHRNGIYLILTSHDVTVQDFCRAVCGFHYFTFPSMVGYTLPYAWIGNSAKQCPEVCAYPFAVPGYMGGGGPGALKSPNDDVGIDGMISVIAHELAELTTNPLVNAWYAGEDPTAPTEIGDLCEGLYGTGGGGGYIGQVMRDRKGRTFNMNGRRGRRFLVQWVWSPVLKACVGPNALD